MSEMMSSLFFIAQGVGVTLQYTAIAFVGGSAIAILIALLKHYRKCLWLVNPYVSFLRGTPLLVQLTLVYFVLPGLVGLDISIFTAGAIAFSLNASAYIAEIIRAGLNSIDEGQFEAANALDIPPLLIWKDIIFPQALKNILPALVNELITLTKETALISTLGEQDIMRRAQLVSAEHYSYLLPLCTAAICYYGLTLIIEQSAKKFERVWSYD